MGTMRVRVVMRRNGRARRLKPLGRQLARLVMEERVGREAWIEAGEVAEGEERLDSIVIPSRAFSAR